MTISPNVGVVAPSIRRRLGSVRLEQLEWRALLAGDFVSTFGFAPLAAVETQADSAVTVDSSGNAIMAGSFAGTTIDFDPSGGTTNLVSASGGDAYVAKYSQAGALVWARQIRSTSGGAGDFAKAVDVTTDAVGNVYVAGQFAGTADFDPGAGTQALTTTGGRREQFALKLDAAGNFVWARQIASAGTNAFAGGIAVDAAGDVAVAGSASTTAIGDRGDVLVTKLDPTGVVAWTRRTEIVDTRLEWTVYPNELPDVAFDPAGNVIVAGTFHGRPVFGRGEAGETRMNGGESGDVFAWKLTSGGATTWARSEGSGGFDFGNGLAVDAGGNVFLAGELGGWSDMDPRKSVTSLIEAENTNAFLSKLTPAGDLAWARHMGRRDGRFGQSYADAVAVAADGSLYISGKIMGYVDLDPNPSATFVIIGKNADDSRGVNFVTKLDAGGAFVYARSFAGRAYHPDYSNHLSMALSRTNGHLFLTDTFDGVRDFNPSSVVTADRTADREDVFMLELTA